MKGLVRHSYYYFLDGYLVYNQIVIVLKDQKKIIFMFPCRTYAYRQMPFGLCNALATFQKCMKLIFNNMIEKYIKIFLDDFLVLGDSSNDYL